MGLGLRPHIGYWNGNWEKNLDIGCWDWYWGKLYWASTGYRLFCPNFKNQQQKRGSTKIFFTTLFDGPWPYEQPELDPATPAERFGTF